MHTVRRYFFEGLRTAYLADAPASRFTDDVLWEFFITSLLAMYSSQKAAFNHIAENNRPHSVFARDKDEVLALLVTDIIALDYAPQLLDNVYKRASLASQRGTQRGAPLQIQLEESDRPK